MTDIRFLFRFRDLVALTLEEHQNIIRTRGWCWWGWWKRPSEDSRADIWDELAAEASIARPVPVGLFDSGSGLVYRALVTAVVKPAPTVGSTTTVSVPNTDTEHVPAYYRESPFSRAWMKIVEIDPQPLEFFGHYSFAEAPRLPNYTASTLRRFANKKIYSDEELRGMDTTIWRIRSARSDDSNEEILLSVQAIPEAISTDLVKCTHDTILHLTDMHFSVGSNRAKHVWRLESETGDTRHTMVEAIATALADRKIGLLILSGDFTFTGIPEEFEEARVAIAHLLGVLDLSPDHVIIVPGNHDIQWTNNVEYDHNAEVRQAPPQARRNYEQFYRAVFRHEPSRHLSMGRRFALPCGFIVETCALNSSSLETGSKFLAGMGRIDEASFGEIAQQLGWTTNQTAAIRLLIIHHHLALTEDLEPAHGYGRGYGLAVDAVRVQRLAARKGVHLALHGHKHRSFIWRSSIYELPERTQTEYKLGELSIVGGGSAGSSETEGASNYFNIMKFTPGKMTVEIFRSINQGGFSPIQSWDAEFSMSNSSGSLRLGDWNKVGERNG